MATNPYTQSLPQQVMSTVRPLNTRMAVQPMTSGGYQRAAQPNPNSGMATYARGQQDTTNPLGAGIGQMQRGMANRQAYDYEASTAPRATGAPNFINSVLPDARWEGLKQALAERGTDKLRTGAAAKWDAPGFFDLQTKTNQAQDPRDAVWGQETPAQAGLRKHFESLFPSLNPRIR